MLKVAQFVGSMNLGGAETLLMHILRNLDNKRFRFIFMENVLGKTYYTDEIIKLGGEIIKTPEFSYKRITPYYRWLVDWFKTEKPDIVHSHTYLHSWIVLAAAKKAGIKRRIAHSHSGMHSYNNGSWLRWKLQKKILKHFATDLVACSKEAKKDLFEDHPNTVIIKNPVDLADFSNIKKADVVRLRERYNAKEGTILIGNVGRLMKQKNHEFLLGIAQELQKKKIDFKMLFLGDGDLRKLITKKIKQYRLDDKVFVVGNVKNVPTYLMAIDVFAMPSYWEGLSLAALEAQASGVYCILSDTVSAEVKVNDNVKFLPLELDRWAEEITNSDERISRSKAAVNLRNQGFDIHSVTANFEDLYHE